MKGSLAFPKPKDKTAAYPVVHVYPDDREECSYLAAGRAEYARRTTLMLDRQNGICCLHGHAPMCTGHLRRQGATFEHERGRGHGGGKHDDRTELPDGTWINGAAHWECNNWKGSRYIDYNRRFREGASMTDTAVPQIPQMPETSNCSHNALRKKRGNYTFDCYVCGNCAALFEVELHVEPPPAPKEPMFDGRPPWGSRSRQA